MSAGLRAVPLLLVLGCCPPVCPPAPVAPPPAGRASGPLYCRDGHPPQQIRAACTAQRVGIAPPPPPSRPYDRASVPEHIETVEERCRVDRISLCGLALEGPRGSVARYCPDGVAQLVAPDRSVLVEGVCVGGAPRGAWLWWSAGRLARAVAIVNGTATGLDLQWDGHGYQPNPSLELPD